MSSLLRTRHFSPRTLALLRPSRPSLRNTATPQLATRPARAGFHHAARRWQQQHEPSVFHTQLEDPAAASAFESLRAMAAAPKQTLTEKIVQKYAVGLPAGQYVKSGDFVTISPHHCMSHDNTWPIAKKFMSIGATTIKNKKQIVMTLDHDVQNKSEANLKKYQLIEEFAGKQGVDFYPAGRGIGHQIMCEEGYVWPGSMVVASDSHSNMYGGLGALGTAIVRTDAAAIWAAGCTWWQVPPVVKINLTGQLPEGVTGKDVIVALCGLFNKDEVLNHAIEFSGSEETMHSIQIDDRLAIANMTTEFGALSGMFPIDSVLLGWLRFKATEDAMWGEPGRPEDSIRFTHARVEELANNKLEADPGAKYAKELYLNLSTLSPYVSGPNSVKVATPVAELEPQQIKVDRTYLVSCTNSRASDIAAAAKVFRDAAEKSGGKIPKIASHVSMYIAAASSKEQKIAEEQGDWQVLLDAGAQELPSGCGPCIGLGTGLLQPGEVGVSSSNRNFKSRMGSADASAYLASPEVVAASALNGVISGPGRYQRPEGWTAVEYGEGDGIKEGERMVTAEEALDRLIGQIDGLLEKAEAETSATETETETEDDSAQTSILPGFPEQIEGEIVFCDVDACNTDGIYPGKLTYQDDVTKEQMADACMSNYDPSFRNIAKPGDILVAGYSFGVGSSREQAATSILAKGIPLVVAGSFSQIYSRNSVNNALMGLEVPKLVERLRQAFPAPEAVQQKQQQQQQEVKEPSLNQESLDSPPPAPPSEQNPKVLTRRTGWRLKWDVRRSKVVIDEGNGKTPWSVKVGSLPENVQEIIAKGGLENWVKAQIGA